MHCGVEEDVAPCRNVLKNHTYAQGTSNLNGLVEVFVAWNCDQVVLIAAWIGHEPYAKLCDDTKGALAENAVVIWTETCEFVSISVDQSSNRLGAYHN